MTMQYDFTMAKNVCSYTGLVYDARMEAPANEVFAKANLDQSQVDLVLLLHVNLVAFLFKPQSYSWFQRIQLVLHFLGLGKRIKVYDPTA